MFRQKHYIVCVCLYTRAADSGFDVRMLLTYLCSLRPLSPRHSPYPRRVSPLLPYDTLRQALQQGSWTVNSSYSLYLHLLSDLVSLLYSHMLADYSPPDVSLVPSGLFYLRYALQSSVCQQCEFAFAHIFLDASSPARQREERPYRAGSSAKSRLFKMPLFS